MQRVLSFEQTPLLSIPLRFLLTAPVFALLAALLLVWQGPNMLASRWLPATLAFTHLLTIGFLSMTMVGALIQILYVVVGITLVRPRLSTSLIHVLLTAGGLLLSLGFLSAAPLLFKMAVACLVLGFGTLLAVCGAGMYRLVQANPMVSAIRWSLAGLSVTVVLGAAAAGSFAWQLALPLIELTDVHAAWGLFGWVGILIIGVAYQVVPMFQVTPIYPATLSRWLAVAIVIGLALWSAARLLPLMPPSSLVSSTAAAGIAQLAALTSLLTLAAAGLAFSVSTLRLLRRRKRPPDAGTQFWRIGICSLLAAALLWLAGEMRPALADAPWFALTTGALFIVGFAVSIVNGMLYKIVPFLIWYHLQHQLSGQGRKAPNVRQIITESAASAQCRMHLCSVVLLAAAPVWPQMLARLAGGFFALSIAWLGWNLLNAARIYQTARQAASDRPSASPPVKSAQSL